MRKAACRPVTLRGKKAVAISVSDCVRSAVRRKPASADAPTFPRTDLALATSMRGSGQLAAPSEIGAGKAIGKPLRAGQAEQRFDGITLRKLLRRNLG